MRSSVRFVLDGAVVQIDRPPPTLTVLDYLREIAERRGTKEGCAEGDCGACTVLVGELSGDRERIDYRAVNSCIRFLPTLDGKELVTVESLEQPSGELHPVQQSMVDHHGSQCGFCTPGFVMSLLALYLRERDLAPRGAHDCGRSPVATRDGTQSPGAAQDDPQSPAATQACNRERVLEALSGNLCRCTGYRPIIEAGLAQDRYPEPQRWSRAAVRSPQRRALLAQLRDEREAAPLDYPGFRAPRTLAELAAARLADPDALVLAGGTDLGLAVTKQLRDLPALLYVGEVAELARIEERPEGLWIGAAVTLTDAWPALLHRFPELKEQSSRFSSPPIRNSATLCGNLANGSPIGDSIPALIALDARLELRCGKAVRQLPLEEFYRAYQVKDLGPGEWLTGVLVPPAAAGRVLASYKLSKRIDQDISAVSATFCVSLAGDRVLSARLAFGGMAATARRAVHAERALLATGWSERGIEAGRAALATDFEPLADLRAGREYRMRTAGNLLRRFYLEQTQATSAPLGRQMALRTGDALRMGAAVGAGEALPSADALRSAGAARCDRP